LGSPLILVVNRLPYISTATTPIMAIDMGMSCITSPGICLIVLIRMISLPVEKRAIIVSNGIEPMIANNMLIFFMGDYPSRVTAADTATSIRVMAMPFPILVSLSATRLAGVGIMVIGLLLVRVLVG